MMDYNHRRAASDMAYTNSSANANRRSGPVPRSAFAVNLEVPVQQFVRTASFDNIAAQNRINASKTGSNNTSSHIRSQSCEGTYVWESNSNQTPAPKSSSSHRYSGLITPEDFPQPQLQNALLAPCSGLRRGSESSTNSTASTCTTVAEGASAWSAATTPETMSPTSPNSMILLQSPPERTSSKMGIVVTEPASMPTPTRPSRARAASHSALKGFHNTPIESPVPEDAEVFLTLRSSRMQRSRPSQEANIATHATAQTAEGIDISSLHQRRQQRQQKIAGKPQVKQPVRLRLTPLPTPPADVQLGRTPSIRTPNSTISPRTLKSSRSMPQIRDHAGPPPAGPLPPIPAMPKMSPSTAGSMPPTPLSSTFDILPPHPSMPPPPPPHSPALSTTSSSRTLIASATHAQMQTQQQTDKSASWEEELRRHKKLLEQFPLPADHMDDAAAPKLTRNHRSLGNLRVRSRSLSRAAASSSGSSSREDSVVGESSAVGESWMAQTYSSFSLRGSKSQQRPSTSKSNKDFRTMDQPLPPLPAMPQEHKPSISVFEDDSEDEGGEGGDVVRKFVRNLFTRRTRSHVDMHAAKENKDPNGREGKSSVSSASSKESSAHGHNDRKKNHSASSNLSMATTVGANNCTSTTNTLTPTTPEVPAVEYCEPLEYHHNKDSLATSPRSLADRSQPSTAPAAQKAPLAPLLTRMFVRRSN
ncbi:hypothetical protein F503_06202 [Ophiostoma piceae UAMH 11346]|uniref:Uncharacterized protein n=1 Tax=Ophiostoma piceae (strain UAMH 11346) TaxID=1262450 RepID=S3CE82_OPHP1|nr:hypothetical protein F503_06202 [Ophiostoma piceae UAMH 11346]